MDPKSLRHFYSIFEAMWIYQKKRRTTERSQLSSDICKSDSLDRSLFSKSGLAWLHLARKIKEVQRCCSLALNYSSEGSVITVLILHWGAQAPYQLVEEQHGLQNTSTNHPSVAIVYQNHMWLWCLLIIMRMKISSIWLLPHKLRSVKCSMCPGKRRSFCSQIQKLQPLLIGNIQKLKLWILNARNSLLLSLFHRVSSILTQKEQEITFPLSGFAPKVIRSLDTVIPRLLFSPP